MNSIAKALIEVFAIVALILPPAFAGTDRGKLISRGEDGSVCYERDVEQAEQYLKKMEAAEKSGKIKEAFEAATKSPSPACMPEHGYDRMFGIVERNYKKLGQQAEKSGRIYDAHKYYIYPFYSYFRNGMYKEYEKKYSLTDAHRTMLAYGKANPNDFKIVEEVVRYFNAFSSDKPSQMKDSKDLAKRGGDNVLAKEEKDFAARKYKAAYEDLQEAEKWFALAEDERSVYTRGKMRAESLLKENAYGSIEQAFEYYNVTLLGETYTTSRDTGRARAGKLGDAAERKGDLELARKFYRLSDDEAKYKSVENRLGAIQEQKEKQEADREQRREQARIKQEKAEPKRQEKFKKEQESLEKELGL